LTNTILKRKKPRKLDLTGVDAMLAFLTGIFGGDGGSRTPVQKQITNTFSERSRQLGFRHNSRMATSKRYGYFYFTALSD